MSDNLLEQLTKALCVLPGVGPKSAQRMSLHLLNQRREAGLHLAALLEQAMQQLLPCPSCRNYTSLEVCARCLVCEQGKAICVVETPADLLAIDATGYKGFYFVLHGKLSPIDGIKPENLGLEILHDKLKENPPQELILATSTTVEGLATAYYIAEMAKMFKVPCSRMAQGLPFGDDLNFFDTGTLRYALQQRERMA